MKKFLNTMDDILNNTALDENSVKTLMRAFSRGGNKKHRAGAMGEILSYAKRSPDSNQVKLGGKQGPDWGSKLTANKEIKADSVLVECKATTNMNYLENGASKQFEGTMIRYGGGSSAKAGVSTLTDAGREKILAYLQNGTFHLDITWLGTGGIDEKKIADKFKAKLEKIRDGIDPEQLSDAKRTMWTKAINDFTNITSGKGKGLIIEQVN